MDDSTIWAALLIVCVIVGFMVWGFNVAEHWESPMVATVREDVAAQVARNRRSGTPYPPAQAPAGTVVSTPTPPTYQATPVSRGPTPYERWALAEANRLARLNAQRQAVNGRIQWLQQQYSAVYAEQMSWGTQHEEALRAGRAYERALQRGDLDARYETRAMRLASLRSELASRYEQMANLYQQDEPGYASWCRQVAGDIRAQRIP